MNGLCWCEVKGRGWRWIYRRRNEELTFISDFTYHY